MKQGSGGIRVWAKILAIEKLIWVEERLLRPGLTNFDLVDVSTSARGTAHYLACFPFSLPFALGCLGLNLTM